MSYEQFMRELDSLLVGVPAEEREEALQYYSDYFADAGKENEEEVLRELGGPKKVAALIKAGLKGGMDSGEFTERGYMDEQFVKKDGLVRREAKAEKKDEEPYFNRSQQEYCFNGSQSTAYGNGANGASYNSSNYTYGNESYGNTGSAYDSASGPDGGGSAYNNRGNMYSNGMGSDMQGNTSYGEKKGPWTNRGLKILLIVLIVLFAFPVLFPVAITIIAVAFGLICAAFGIFIALAACAGGIMIAGFAIACGGLTKLFVSPPVALLAMGFGLVIFVIGLVAVVAAVRLCLVIFPALFRFFVGLCRKPFHKNRM